MQGWTDNSAPTTPWPDLDSGARTAVAGPKYRNAAMGAR
jgi:hypothetical protein